MEERDYLENDRDTELENTYSREPKESSSRFKRTFTALKYRNYKLWFWGQMTSLLGTWMQITAQGFLVYELTHSPVFLGYVGFAAGIPTWLFMIYGGVIADRFPKRDILLVTQIVMMILAAVLAILTFLNIIQPWEIVALAFLLGIANAFDAPSRQAFVNELVHRDDLTNAIALNSTMFNTATASGPAIAGITYALFGPAWCFTINAISFIGIIIALKKMKLKQFVPKKRKASTFDEMKEGVHYVATHTAIGTIVLLVGVISVFGLSFATLLPAWAVKILGGDATTNGLLQSARGVGALISALFIASLGRFTFKGKLLTIGSILFPILMIVFSFIHWLPVSLLVLLGLGASLILVFNLANALIQTLVTDELRGRVMGVYTFTFFGFMPLGSLIMGTMAEHFGEPFAITVGALITISAALLILIFVPTIRKLN